MRNSARKGASQGQMTSGRRIEEEVKIFPEPRRTFAEMREQSMKDFNEVKIRVAALKPGAQSRSQLAVSGDLLQQRKKSKNHRH